MAIWEQAWKASEIAHLAVRTRSKRQGLRCSRGSGVVLQTRHGAQSIPADAGPAGSTGPAKEVPGHPVPLVIRQGLQRADAQGMVRDIPRMLRLGRFAQHGGEPADILLI